jgi:hypothetical protein
MRCVLVLSALVVACGGASASAPGSSSTVRTDLACTEAQPTGEFDCVARGCQWGPPLWCSGVAEESDAWSHDAARPCTCTCQSDVMECASRP